MANGGAQVLSQLTAALGERAVELVDLTHVLDEHTPPIRLPPPKASPPRFALRELSRYDERGEHEYWNAFETGEHVGTHFDAPIHWHTGRDREDVLGHLPGAPDRARLRARPSATRVPRTPTIS